MKNYDYMSLPCLQPDDSRLDAVQPTDGSDFLLHMGNSMYISGPIARWTALHSSHTMKYSCDKNNYHLGINGYDLQSEIDNTFYQQLNCSNEAMDVPSQYSYFSPAVPSSFLPTTIDNLALGSPPPLINYHCSLPCDSTPKSHSLLIQPWQSERLPPRNSITKDITRVDISKTSKKRKADQQIINIRQSKLAPVRRSQKLSDKINALQELVSPYGKTDTASVLQEACIYIKIIHQELRRLSISYFEARSFRSQFQGDLERQADLRSRGLCVVPISIMKRLTRSESWGDQHEQAASRNSGKPRNF